MDEYKALILAFGVHYPGFIPFFVNLMRSQGDPPRGISKDSWEYDYLDGSGNEVYHRELDGDGPLPLLYKGNVRGTLLDVPWSKFCIMLFEKDVILFGYGQHASKKSGGHNIDVFLSPRPSFKIEETVSSHATVKTLYLIASSEEIVTNALLQVLSCLRDEKNMPSTLTASIQDPDPLHVDEIEMSSTEAQNSFERHTSYDAVRDAVEDYLKTTSTETDETGNLHAAKAGDLVRKVVRAFGSEERNFKMVLDPLFAELSKQRGPLQNGATLAREYTKLQVSVNEDENASNYRLPPVYLIFDACAVHYVAIYALFFFRVEENRPLIMIHNDSNLYTEVKYQMKQVWGELYREDGSNWPDDYFDTHKLLHAKGSPKNLQFLHQIEIHKAHAVVTFGNRNLTGETMDKYNADKDNILIGIALEKALDQRDKDRHDDFRKKETLDTLTLQTNETRVPYYDQVFCVVELIEEKNISFFRQFSGKGRLVLY